MSAREWRAGFLVCLAGYYNIIVKLDCDGDGLVVLIPLTLAEFSVDWWQHNLCEFADEIHQILQAERADAGEATSPSGH
jgi:hypothetical protein